MFDDWKPVSGGWWDANSGQKLNLKSFKTTKSCN